MNEISDNLSFFPSHRRPTSVVIIFPSDVKDVRYHSRARSAGEPAIRKEPKLLGVRRLATLGQLAAVSWTSDRRYPRPTSTAPGRLRPLGLASTTESGDPPPNSNFNIISLHTKVIHFDSLDISRSGGPRALFDTTVGRGQRWLKGGGCNVVPPAPHHRDDQIPYDCPTPTSSAMISPSNA